MSLQLRHTLTVTFLLALTMYDLGCGTKISKFPTVYIHICIALASICGIPGNILQALCETENTSLFARVQETNEVHTYVAALTMLR